MDTLPDLTSELVQSVKKLSPDKIKRITDQFLDKVEEIENFLKQSRSARESGKELLVDWIMLASETLNDQPILLAKTFVYFLSNPELFNRVVELYGVNRLL